MDVCYEIEGELLPNEPPSSQCVAHCLQSLERVFLAKESREAQLAEKKAERAAQQKAAKQAQRLRLKQEAQLAARLEAEREAEKQQLKRARMQKRRAAGVCWLLAL